MGMDFKVFKIEDGKVTHYDINNLSELSQTERDWINWKKNQHEKEASKLTAEQEVEAKEQ